MRAEFISPELATLTENYFSNKEWIYEEKFDGYRCIAVCSKGKITLFSRNHLSLNDDFPEIVKALQKSKKHDYVIDGEIVAFKGKVSSFEKMQRRKIEKIQAKFFVFDILIWDGQDLRKLPLALRKEKLKKKFPFNDTVHYTPHIVEKGEAFYKKACKRGLEGIIAKKISSKYQSKRTRDWLKFKCGKGGEFIICGYTDPKGSRTAFGALLLGYYDRKELKYAGKVGTGFSEELLESIGKKLKKLEQSSSPFKVNPQERHAHFVRPKLVCEIGFTEWTNEGKLRHPRFLGLRIDKEAREVVREIPK